jgi:1-acyl-sn-glycerol-3-phosphate acyltransferase
MPSSTAHLDFTPAERASTAVRPLDWRTVLRGSLREMDGSAGGRIACRLVAATLGRRIRSVTGTEHVMAAADPFILVLNHSQKAEALAVPALLAFLRGGRRVHFMADWNFLFIPLVGYCIRAGGSIIVGRKPAKPAFLNRFKSRLVPPKPPFTQASELLACGRSVGIFPEGTVNRHPAQLLRGLTGAARLALHTGVPVVPAGIRFPDHVGTGPISDREPMTVHFGEALRPPVRTRDAAVEEEFHARLMRAVAALSDKTWDSTNPRKHHAHQ